MSQIANELLCRVRQIARSRGLAGLELHDETNLVETGILDSVEFVNLLIFLEAECGYQLDIANIDPEQFSNIRGLCELATRSRAEEHHDTNN